MSWKIIEILNELERAGLPTPYIVIPQPLCFKWYVKSKKLTLTYDTYTEDYCVRWKHINFLDVGRSTAIAKLKELLKGDV